MLGSVAEVERLWSIVDNYLDGCRNKTTPLLMEAFVFLRVNKDFWDEHTIVEAYHRARDGALSSRAQSMVSEDDIFINTIW